MVDGVRRAIHRYYFDNILTNTNCPFGTLTQKIVRTIYKWCVELKNCDTNKIQVTGTLVGLVEISCRNP